MIQPTYVTFEQAKLLKKKGFDEQCSHSYKETEPVALYQHQDKMYNNSFKKEWQNTVRKNSQMLDATISRYSAPEQWQVVEWLRSEREIWISIEYRLSRFTPNIQFVKRINKDTTVSYWSYFETSQEAYSAAFDYVLNNLI